MVIVMECPLRQPPNKSPKIGLLLPLVLGKYLKYRATMKKGYGGVGIPLYREPLKIVTLAPFLFQVDTSLSHFLCKAKLTIILAVREFPG